MCDRTAATAAASTPAADGDLPGRDQRDGRHPVPDSAAAGDADLPGRNGDRCHGGLPGTAAAPPGSGKTRARLIQSGPGCINGAGAVTGLVQ